MTPTYILYYANLALVNVISAGSSFITIKLNAFESVVFTRRNFISANMFVLQNGLSVKARTEPNQTEPAEITEPAQPNLRKLTDNYDYRYSVLSPLPIRTLVWLTSSSLIIIIIIRSIIITITLK